MEMDPRFRRNPSPSPSISSMATDIGDVPPEEIEVRSHVKKILLKRIFLGHYQERRFVENLNLYRDVVVLHSSEAELKVDVESVLSKLRSFFKGDMWIGITSPETIGGPYAGYCLWTKLQDVPFGFYWFQVRRICYEFGEIRIKLKVIRPVKEEIVTPIERQLNIRKSISDNIDALKSCIRTSVHSMKESHPSASSSLHSSSSMSDKGKQEPHESSSHVKENTAPDSTSNEHTSLNDNASLKLEDFIILLRLIAHSWKDILIFLSAAVVGTLNGLGKSVQFVGEFSLKFMHEVSFLLRTITPIILAVIELVGKMIGGLYILFAMLIRGGNGRIPGTQLAPPIQNRKPLPIQYNINNRSFR